MLPQLSPSDQSRRRGFARGVLAYVFLFFGLRNPMHYYAGDFGQKRKMAEIHCMVGQELTGGRAQATPW
jgi:hypothetical protein